MLHRIDLCENGLRSVLFLAESMLIVSGELTFVFGDAVLSLEEIDRHFFEIDSIDPELEKTGTRLRSVE